MYKLSNHPGNVTTTFSENIEIREEKKTVGGSVQTTLYQVPQLISFTDYTPFGLNIDRIDNPVLETKYRYGFNGKEQDDNGEWGDLTHYDYGFRIYNPAIARFLSVDPLSPVYPMLTPYQFASNTPIVAIDLDGLEAETKFEARISEQVAPKIGMTNCEFIDATRPVHVKDPKVSEAITMGIAETGAGFVPYVGQALDAKDTYNAFYKGGTGWDKTFAIIGWVPGIGDAAKGIRRFWKATDNGVDAVSNAARKLDDVAGAGISSSGNGKGLEELREQINPSGNNFNCVRCSVEFAKKIFGKEFGEAVARSAGDGSYAKTIREAFPNTSRKMATGGLKGLDGALSEAKSKAVVIVGHYRSGRQGNTSAHAFNGVKDKDGNWSFIDTQNGSISTKSDLDEKFGRYEVFDLKE